MPSALVLGDAACVHKDVAEALKLFTPDAIAAVNRIGIVWEDDVDYWFTLHPNSSIDWPGMHDALNQRLKAGRNKPVTVSHTHGKAIDHVIDQRTGSSGLLAVWGMLKIGYDRIVCCGMPMDSQPHFYHAKNWAVSSRYHKGWIQYQEDLRPYVRSCSGWTRDLLGAPTAEWLAESAAIEGG